MAILEKIFGKYEQKSIDEVMEDTGLVVTDLPIDVRMCLKEPDFYDVWAEGIRKKHIGGGRNRITGKVKTQFKISYKDRNGVWIPDQPSTYEIQAVI